MICDPETECTNCSGPRILPWTQDVDADGNGDGDVWEAWDITLRDFVVLDRDGIEVTRINLTSINPDPDSTCGENYETIKNLLLELR